MKLKLALATLMALAAPVWAQDAKPNILVIWGDDVGYDNISAYNLGMMGYKTPNIDRIAKQGAALHRLVRPTELHSRPRRIHNSVSIADPRTGLTQGRPARRTGSRYARVKIRPLPVC